MNNSSSLPQLTPRQVSRSAGSTIAGYQYQFERSVVAVLGLDDGDTLRVEGIEDIDIWSASPSVVQVKYYEGQKWSPSAVREAVHELLRSFVAGLNVEYILYVHFGTGEAPPESFDLQDLKDCLTYRPRGKPVERLYDDLQDDQLIAFTNLFRICHGVSLEDQRKITAAVIAKALRCSEDEAESLHRMRAIQFLHEIAINKDENRRVVTRNDLIDFLGDRDVIYNRWHKEIVGRERFISAITKKLKLAGFATSNTYRGVYLRVTAENLEAVCRLAAELARDLNGAAKRRLTTAKPWTLILRGEVVMISAVKKSLIEEQLMINDGFELLHFSPELFIEPAVVRGTGRTDRLAKASHVIRIVSEDSMKRVTESGYRLAQVISVVEPDIWHSNIARVGPMRIHEISVDDLTEILRRVTT